MSTIEEQDRCTRGEPDCVIVVDDEWRLIGVGVDLDHALREAREWEHRDLCPYCDCGKDESGWHAYRAHPYAYDVLREGYGDHNIRFERLSWDAKRGHFRWISWPTCEACGGTGEPPMMEGSPAPAHALPPRWERPVCKACDGEGSLNDETDDGELPEETFRPPPPQPEGSIWQGKRSRCIELRERAEGEDGGTKVGAGLRR